MVIARIQNVQRSSSLLNRYRSWAVSLNDYLFIAAIVEAPPPTFLLPLPHEMSSKTDVRREGFKALIEMKRFPECDPGWDPILHDLQGDPIDTWGSKPKYDPLESDDKWIQNVKDLLTREGVPEAEQPQKAVKFIANPTISTELGVAMEDVIKRYGHIEWGWFERFMVEFQSEWYFFLLLSTYLTENSAEEIEKREYTIFVLL